MIRICGLQKMTLLDYPGKVACTVFLGGCDLRCPFCHNAELIDGTAPAVMDSGELLAFLKKRQGLLEGVAVTGGEPLLRGDELTELAERIRDLGYPLKLDTNGTHPDRLREIISRGLAAYVAMDIKNSPGKYAGTIGLPSIDLSPIRRSISLLMKSGKDYEFRTTVVSQFHEDRDFEEIGRMIQGARVYYLQAFTDRDSVPFAGLSAPSKEELERYAGIVRPFVGQVHIRGVD